MIYDGIYALYSDPRMIDTLNKIATYYQGLRLATCIFHIIVLASFTVQLREVVVMLATVNSIMLKFLLKCKHSYSSEK